MPRWCRSLDGSRIDPRHTDHASAFATWTLLTRATSSAWPPTHRGLCPRQACSLLNLVRAESSFCQACTSLLASRSHNQVVHPYCDKQEMFSYSSFPFRDLAPFSNTPLNLFLLVAGSLCREKSGSNIVYPLVKKSPCLLFQIHSLLSCQEGQRKFIFFLSVF